MEMLRKKGTEDNFWPDENLLLSCDLQWCVVMFQHAKINGKCIYLPCNYFEVSLRHTCTIQDLNFFIQGGVGVLVVVLVYWYS